MDEMLMIRRQWTIVYVLWVVWDVFEMFDNPDAWGAFTFISVSTMWLSSQYLV